MKRLVNILNNRAERFILIFTGIILILGIFFQSDVPFLKNIDNNINRLGDIFVAIGGTTLASFICRVYNFYKCLKKRYVSKCIYTSIFLTVGAILFWELGFKLASNTFICLVSVVMTILYDCYSKEEENRKLEEEKAEKRRRAERRKKQLNYKK